MVTFLQGDLLKSGCNVICHQVNLDGYMGGGLALQIARKYFGVEEAYANYLSSCGEGAKGTVYLYQVGKSEYVANCFSQDEYFNTNYSWLKRALIEVERYARANDFTVGLPYGYGCGIANGNWEVVLSVIKEVFEDSIVDCKIYEKK